MLEVQPRPARASAERRFGLDALRALAVLLVVYAHGSVLAVPLWVPGKTTYFLAYLGVELFFVLSGFLVGGLLLDALAEAEAGAAPTRGWIRAFWARRWLRTLPNYYFALALNFAFVALAAQSLPAQWPLYFLFAQNLFGAHPPFFGEAWSLAIEEWFYLLAPLAAWLAAPRLRSRRAVLAGFAALLLGGLLLRVGYVLAYEPSWDGGVRKLALLRLDAIAWGVFAVWLHRQFTWVRLQATPLAVLGLLLSAVNAALYLISDVDHSLLARSWLFSLGSLGAALLLPWAAGYAGHALGDRARRLTVQIALLSYSIYLVHMLVVRGLLEWKAKPSAAGDLILAVVIYLLLTFSAAWALYRGLERPFLRLRDRWVPRSRATAGTS